MAVIAAICSCVLIAGGELCTPWYSIGLSCDNDVLLLHLKFRTDRPRPPLPTDVLSWKNVHHYKLFVLSVKFASMFNCHPTLIKPIQHPWWKWIGPMTTHGEMSISWQSTTWLQCEIYIPEVKSLFQERSACVSPFTDTSGNQLIILQNSSAGCTGTTVSICPTNTHTMLL